MITSFPLPKPIDAVYGDLLPRVCPHNLGVMNGKGWWRAALGWRSCNKKQLLTGALDAQAEDSATSTISSSRPTPRTKGCQRNRVYLVSGVVVHSWARILTTQLSSRHRCRRDWHSRLLSCMASMCQHTHSRLQAKPQQQPSLVHSAVRKHCEAPLKIAGAFQHKNGLQEPSQHKYRPRASLTIVL